MSGLYPSPDLFPSAGLHPEARVGMPRRILTGKALEMLNDLPPVLRGDPDYQAVCQCYGREAERMDAHLDLVRRQFFPQFADPLLKAWEALLRTTIEPPGATLDERRQVVLAMHARLRATASGLAWIANVTKLVGLGWTYDTHDPDVPGSPPANTIRVRLPFPPESGRYAQTEAYLRKITPAAWDLIVTWIGGFSLDRSQMDQEAMQ